MSQTQQRASDPTRSVWVSAHAGTGKTKMLVDRVLRLLLAGTAPESILCITYTKAAAAEMRERIDARVREWSRMADETIANDLLAITGSAADSAMVKKAKALYAELLCAPYHVAIQTIHAFCQSVLQQFPLEAGIAPHFSMIDETTSKALITEAKHQVLYAADEKTSPELQDAWTHIATTLADSTIDDLLDAIVFKREVFEVFWSERVEVEQSIIVAFVYEALNAPVKPIVHQTIYHEAPHSLCLDYMQALDNGSKTETARAATVARFLEMQGDDMHANAAYQSVFLKKDGMPKQMSAIATQKTLKTHPELRTFIEQECQRLAELEEQKKSQAIAEDTIAVVRIACALLNAYSDLKQERGVLDFHDVIHHTQRLLAQADKSVWIRFKLDRYVRHLLLDEAQDTNFSQWMIVRTLMEEWLAGDRENRSLFVVGDYKQSIYRFQGAQPESFVGMQQVLVQQTEVTYGQTQLHEETLDRSFRSTAPVLELVDAVFADSATEEWSIKHQLHRTGQAGHIELWPLVNVQKVEMPSPWQPLGDYTKVDDAISILARDIAQRIKQMMDSGHQLKSYGRAIRADDIMILLQKRGRWAQILTHALQKAGVPVSGRDRLRLNDEILVQDLLALAQHCLLPNDDLVLAGLLKSPLFGLNEEQLFTLCHDRDGSVLEALANDLQYQSDVEKLIRWVEQSRQFSPLAWYRYLFYIEGLESVLLGHYGSASQDVLHAFLVQLEQYESQFTPSLQGFCEWMASGNSEIKRDMEQGGGVVRIMTVHAAKGLQAPVVILPDTTQMQPFKQSIFSYERHDTTLPLYVSGKSYDNDITAVLREQVRQADEEEHRRLLYVALTRAEEQLIISGVGDIEKLKDNTWYAQVRRGMEALECDADNNGGYEYSHQQTSEPDKACKDVMQSMANNVYRPDWMRHRVEVSSLEKSGPFREGEESDVLSDRKRGILMHSILQWNVSAHEVPEKLKVFLQHYHPTIRDEETNYFQMTLEGLHASVECRDVLLAKGLHEVSIVSLDAPEQEPRHHQIDKLIITGNSIQIVDYKTTSLPAGQVEEVDGSVLKQLARYRSAIAQQYPDHTISCSILWTHTATLMTLPVALVDSAAQSLDVAA